MCSDHVQHYERFSMKKKQSCFVLLSVAFATEKLTENTFPALQSYCAY